MRTSLVLVALAGAASSGCVARPRMCGPTIACAAQSTCVAGRCQADGAKAAIQEARRVVFDPVATAYVHRGESASGGALPRVFTLGRQDDDAVLLLRFAVPLSPDAKVVEAYVLLERSDSQDPDPTPLALHAARIVTPWDARTASWAVFPRLEDIREPSTRVPVGGRSVVRVDVRSLVQRWPQRDAEDQGIAIVADNATPTGMAFAFGPATLPKAEGETPPKGSETGAAEGSAAPRLELYLR